MKKILLLGILFPFIAISQTDNKIEGLTINTPCELEYTRNLGNQNNYSCVLQNIDETIFQYSVTVQNLFEEMNNFQGKQLQSFKNSFLQAAKQNAISNGESTESIILANGQKALKIKSYLTYSGNKFNNTSIVFLYKQKSFIVNLTTNDLNSVELKQLNNRIKIK
ncbi:hypothetical protein [Gillisia hiemivivida]|uniref:DUF4252 domain-containing protein n=1 Tax=Gillisia hiemivivida TaxID=291190 RepID=A0A5C6ZXJ2_9FLAO|nr:hypothetical protein [Gillisia hiemivivida]TXD95667.1 hypothetical protein ES724_01145 [Gillisia hiemivivida]